MFKKIALIRLILLVKWCFEQIMKLLGDLDMAMLREEFDKVIDTLQEILANIDPNEKYEWDDKVLEFLNDIEEKFGDPTD